MKRDDYRREFADFQAARAHARQVGWRQASPFEPLPAPLHDRFSDLWSRTTVETLRQARQADISRPAVEQRGGQVLQVFAENWFIRARTRELDTELHRALTTPFIPWQGKRYAAVTVAQWLKEKADRAAHQELQRRLDTHYASLVDLQAQRRDILTQAARQLGYDSLVDQVAVYSQLLCGEDLATWLAACERFLAETDTAYHRAIAAAAKDAAPPNPFAHRRQRYLAEELLRSFGIRPWQQTNITTDWQATTGITGVFRARIPEDIRWVVAPSSGWQSWHVFLGELARVQQAAWTSPSLPVELRSYGDPSIADAWDWLFANLLADQRWLAGMLDLQLPPAVQRALTVWHWQVVRQAAWRCVAWYGYAVAGRSLEQLRTEAAQYLGLSLSDWELYQELNLATRALGQLRGAWLAAALDDWLRTKYGQWATNRHAGDTLIDLWNTGFRYSAGELATLVGVGLLTMEAFLHR
ncbi:MAG: hypothetical protein ACUVR8_07915 [Acidobacteriota bacterium]